MSVRKSATATSKNTFDTIAQHVNAMEVVCARIANEADERALQTHEALNRMEQSIESIWRGMQMLLERDAAQLAPPTHPSRGRTVDDLLKDGVDALVQRLWNGHVERLVWQTLIITPVEQHSEWSGLVEQHLDVRANSVNGEESDAFCVNEIGCLFNDTVLDERARAFKTALLGSLGKRFGATRRKQKSIWKAAIHSQFKSGDPDTFGGLPEVFGDLQAAQLAVIRLVAFNALPPDGRTWCNSGSMLSDYALTVAHKLAVTPLQTMVRKKSSRVDADADAGADADADADGAAVELAPPQQRRTATLGSAGGKRPSPFSLPKPQSSERSVASVSVASVAASSSATPAKARATPSVSTPVSRASTPSPAETLAATTQRPMVSVTAPLISTTTSKSKGNVEDVLRAHGLSFAKPTLSTADNDTSTTAHRAKQSRTTLIVDDDDDDDNDYDDKVARGGSQSGEE